MQDSLNSSEFPAHLDSSRWQNTSRDFEASKKQHIHMIASNVIERYSVGGNPAPVKMPARGKQRTSTQKIHEASNSFQSLD